MPYRLFALSYAGSLLALIAYPLVVEPRLTLAMQRAGWAAGFVVYAVLCRWLGVESRKGEKETGANEQHPTFTMKLQRMGHPE